jgi:sulfotransferase famil protein
MRSGTLRKLAFRPSAATDTAAAQTVDLYFGTADLAARAPINVFQHTPGTGGMAFRRWLDSNLGPVAKRETRPVLADQSALRDEYARLYGALTDEERARLQWVVGHSANYLIPLLEQPVSVFATVRDPLDLVLSRYLTPGGSKGRNRRTPATLQALYAAAAGDGTMPARRDPNSLVRVADYANGQSRSLLEPFYDVDELPISEGPPADADLWRQRLFDLVEGYALLPRSRLKAAIEAHGRPAWPTSGLEEAAPGQQAEVDLTVRNAVYAYNWLDRELYRHAVDSMKKARLQQRQLALRKRVRLELYFSSELVDQSGPVNLFQDIRLTAGTAFRACLQENLGGAVELTPPTEVKPPADLHVAYRELYEALTEDERARLNWAAGNSANFLVPLLERPVNVFTIVREPVDRILSLFPPAKDPKKRNQKTLEILTRRLAEPREADSSSGRSPKGVDRKTLLGSVDRAELANGQARSLLAPFFDLGGLPITEGPPQNADIWRERLFGLVDSYLLLPQDKLLESIEPFANGMGWSTDYLEQIPAGLRSAEVDPALREIVNAYNWLDSELYRRALSRRRGMTRTFRAFRQVRPPKERPWEQGPESFDPEYTHHQRTYRGERTTPLDLWFSDGPCDEPLVLFQHIRKTAGTSTRHLLHANFGEAGYELVPAPRRGSHDWWTEIRASLGDRFQNLRAVACHSANYLVPLLEGRSMTAFTIVREPVDRVLSRYYFFGDRPGWTLRDLYTGKLSKLQPEFFNGQTRSLLEPLVGMENMPLTPDDPGADEWRDRLVEVAEGYRLIGVQDRMDETVERLADLLGFDQREVFRVRINRDRPASAALDDETAELIRRHNWLDDELYRLANDRLGSR